MVFDFAYGLIPNMQILLYTYDINISPNFALTKMKKIIMFLLALMFVLPTFASAASVADLQAQIASLLTQIQQLQAQLTQQTGQSCSLFNIDLKIGDSGDEVSKLQKFLENQGFGIFDSEKSSSYFGESTAAAVTGFQGKYKTEILIPAGLARGTGYVGYRTRIKLNSLMSCAQTSTTNSNTSDVQAARAALQAILDYDRIHVGQKFTSSYAGMFSSEDYAFLSDSSGSIGDVGVCTISSNTPSSSNGALVFKVTCTVDIGNGSYLMVKENGVWKMAFSRSLKYSIEQEQVNNASIPSDPNGYVDLITDIKVSPSNPSIDDGATKITFTVKNAGTKSVLNQQMKEEIFSGANKKYLVSSGWYPISIPAGQTWEHSFLWKDLKCDKLSNFCFNDAGNIEFYYGINTDKQVTETNYSNNSTVKNIYFSKITSTASNRAPSSPVISGQTSVIAGSSNLYTAVSTDPENDNVTYTFDWGDGTGQDVKTFGSGYGYSVYHNWSSSGIYQITVYASDGKGGQNVGALSVKVSVPASITVTSPAGAAGGQDIEPGSYYTIRWQTSGNFNNGVNLHLCSLSGSCHALGGNSQGVSAAPGFGSYSYSWYVDPNEPFFPGSNFRIKVTDASNSSVYGYSGYFDVGIIAQQPSIHISAVTTGQTSDVYVNANRGTQFTISGVPMNLNLAGNDFTRAFFGSLAGNNCSNNSAVDRTWTMTCTANVTGPTDYYIEIYKNGQTYRSNTVTVNVNP